MKKIIPFILLCSIAVLSLSACSGSKNLSSVSSNSSSTASRSKFTGTWMLNNISYEGVLQNAVTNVFDQAAPAAFRGSTWRLTNSGNGIYTLNDGTFQTIYLSVYNADAATVQQFQFKKIYQGDKAKNVTEGYRLLVSNNDGNTMTLRSPISLGNGSSGYIVYTFNKQ